MIHAIGAAGKCVLDSMMKLRKEPATSPFCQLLCPKAGKTIRHKTITELELDYLRITVRTNIS